MSEFVSGEEVKKLALLARIEISGHEVKKLQKDLGAILDYVSRLKKAPVKAVEVSLWCGGKIFNVFREDESAIKPGEYTENMLKQAPDKERGFIKVKKIL